MDFDKPFRTFEELAVLLRDEHGLAIGNIEETVQVLRFIPYYDLVNGYKDVLMDGERFRYPFNITDLLLFHSFDRNFQSSLMSFSTTVEDYFKNVLAYVIAKNFSVSEEKYLDERHYSRKHSHTGNNITRHDVLDRLRKICVQSMDDPTLYYRNHHNHIPPWILLKNASFSLATNLLVILPSAQKQEVVDIMLPGSKPWDLRYTVLLYSLTMIRKCRNIIAHNLKFSAFDSSKYMNSLNKQVLRSFISPNLLSTLEIRRGKYLTGIYGYIVLSLSLMPNGIFKAGLINRLAQALDMDGLANIKPMTRIVQNIRTIYFDGHHLPQDLQMRLLNYLKQTLPPKS